MQLTRIERADDDRLGDYRLLNDQRGRRAHEGDDFFIAEGYVSIDRVIDSGHRLRSVVLAPSRVSRFAERLDHLTTLGVAHPPVYVVDRDLLADVVGFDLHRGVLASVDRRRLPSVNQLAESATRRLAVLEGLNDAENVGVIARAARALGIDGLVLDPTCTDPYARRTVRVSMGEVLHLPTARARRWPDDLDTLHHAGFDTWAMTPDPVADDIWNTPIPERLAIVLGAEGPGLGSSTIERCRRRVRIPIDPRVDSLNVGHAAAIAFAATSPQRRDPAGRERSDPA